MGGIPGGYKERVPVIEGMTRKEWELKNGKEEVEDKDNSVVAKTFVVKSKIKPIKEEL